MDIIKIGGSKINSEQLFSQLIGYITSYKSNNNNSAFFIISAFSKNTKDLKKCLELSIDKSINNYISLNKIESKQKKKVQQILNQIYQFHLNLVNSIILPNNLNNINFQFDNITNELINTTIQNFKQSFNNFLDEINIVLQNVSYLNYYSAKTMDKVISFGEIFALNTINFGIELHKIIKSNLSNQNIHLINAFDFITTNNIYNNALINESLTFDKLSIILNKIGYSNKNNNEHFTFITQGFIAKSENGEITTMGMESSNLTAAIICKFFDSNKLNIITDTNGIYNCDPRVFSDFNTIEYLDYNQSLDLSKLGLKLLNEQMLQICKDNEIEITYSSILSLNSNITIKTVINSLLIQINKNPVFIVNFNFYKYAFLFENKTDYENHIKESTFGQIEFYKKDNINFSINYFTNQTNSLIKNFNKDLTNNLVDNLVDKEEVTLLTIYNFSKINNELFADEFMNDLIDLIEIDYKNKIAHLIINKIENTENESYLFDKIKNYFS